MAGLERAVADLRADLARHEGGLVRVFADQLKAVLDALEAKPDLTVKGNPEDVHVKLRRVSVIEDPYDCFKGENGLYHLGLTVRVTKKLSPYPMVAVGEEGMLVRYNHNARYVYGVKFENYYSPLNVSRDEIELAV